MYRKIEYNVLLGRIKESEKNIHLISGPRGIGKTTMVEQVLGHLETEGYKSVFGSADFPAPGSSAWLENLWESAVEQRKLSKTILVIDEVQKIPNWLETIDCLWSEEARKSSPLKVILIDSTTFRIPEEGLSSYCSYLTMWHWSFAEMKKAFGFTINQFLFYGGYPGGAAYLSDYEGWKTYMLDSLIETTLSRDLFMMNRVEKPVLLRNLFKLACNKANSIISFTAMQSYLQEKANTTTLSNYLSLLTDIGLVDGLQKFSGNIERKRGSSPKLLPLNTGLINAMQDRAKVDELSLPLLRESLLKVALGAALYRKREKGAVLNYWKRGIEEVDFLFVNNLNGQITAFDLTLNRKNRGSIELLLEEFPEIETIQVGENGIPLLEFL